MSFPGRPARDGRGCRQDLMDAPSGIKRCIGRPCNLGPDRLETALVGLANWRMYMRMVKVWRLREIACPTTSERFAHDHELCTHGAAVHSVGIEWGVLRQDVCCCNEQRRSVRAA